MNVTKKTSEKRGRKTVMTPDVVRKIEEIASLDGTVEEMALFAGIHRDTIYAHLKEDAVFSDRIHALRSRPILKARRTIVNSLTDPVNAFKYAEKKARKEFGANLDITTDGKELPQPLLYAVRDNESNNKDSEPE